MENKKRPVNLDISTLHFPVTAIVSILHRVSGIIIFLLLPFILYCFQQSLESYQSFGMLKLAMASFWYKVPVWIFLSAFTYHVFAGIRHLWMDVGFNESICFGRGSAIFILILSIVAAIGLGVVIW